MQRNGLGCRGLLFLLPFDPFGRQLLSCGEGLKTFRGLMLLLLLPLRQLREDQGGSTGLFPEACGPRF